MPQVVVDRLESIEIEKQQRHPARRPFRRLERLGQPIVEQRSIGQAGQRIVVRHVIQIAPVAAPTAAASSDAPSLRLHTAHRG